MATQEKTQIEEELLAIAYQRILARHYPVKKELAITKYVRKVIASMPLAQLALWHRLAPSAPDDLDELITDTAKGYDRFMAKRAK